MPNTDLKDILKEPPNPELLKYIRECQALGYDDWQIREELMKYGWTIEEIGEAFLQIRYEENQKLKKKVRTKTGKVQEKYKNTLTIHLDSEVYKLIEKRAKKNLFTIEEQAEDILRRSTINQKNKKSLEDEKLDDKFIKLFSRKKSGKPRKE